MELERYITLEVTATLTTGNGVYGKLKAVAEDGISILAKAQTNDELPEEYMVFIPRNQIVMVHANESDNNKKSNNLLVKGLGWLNKRGGRK